MERLTDPWPTEDLFILAPIYFQDGIVFPSTSWDFMVK